MSIDYHLHSQFSGDSKTSIETICQAAISQNLQEIAITDHMDYSYPSIKPDHQIADIDNYLNTIAYYQQRYRDVLTIRAGIEIGMEPHCLELCDRMLRQYPFDFVIGSIHECHGLQVSKAMFFDQKTKEQAYETYYKSILECIQQFDNFDVIGHLDYCKRYYPSEYETEDYLLALPLIDEILQTLIAKGKGLEVNTSGFRHTSQMCMPHFNILTRYQKMGGTRITIGSDSHFSEFVGFHAVDTARQLKQIGFKHISTFEQRIEITRLL